MFAVASRGKGFAGNWTRLRKREVNQRKNLVWDSLTALASSSAHRFLRSIPVCGFLCDFPERAMSIKTLVLVLTLACLANVICLVGYL